MRTITIRECAIDAINAIEDERNASALLLAICNEALGSSSPDFEDQNKFCGYDARVLPAVYKAIAPDIIGSVNDDAVDEQAVYRSILDAALAGEDE